MKQPFDSLPLPQQAGILCNDTRFQRFAAVRSGFPDGQFTQNAAAEYLRTTCKITSRRELETNADAATYFTRLRTDFDAWTGKIPSPR